ncbi:uncharacterized protein LOC117784851 [Drosophila innubila]|uniref:uncharacterized protein LOC117784851 n=1 Tax=Drosophila innubila TaxID=198719 RepID=UPI00148CA7A7|nr:uncharacterized protein LOC117784851 [Drosophila innubila]
MFNNQNKEVKTKFQNERNSFSAKPHFSKSTLPATCPVRSNRITLPRYLNQSNAKLSEPKTTLQVAKSEPKQQLIKSPVTIRSTPKLKAKSVDICSTARVRSGAATLNRISRPFVTSCRIFRPSSSKIFDYHLSREEQNYFDHCPKPMKSVPVDELQLLRSGQRATYLETRYERTPDDKYNYPEATSWRYGWFHRKST